MDNKEYNFVTVLTFTYSHELMVVRALLESQDIMCFVKDELTTLTIPYYSNAIGGIKLQVKEIDLPRAIDILKENGYITEKDLTPDKSIFDIDAFTTKYPFLKKKTFRIKLLIWSAVAIALISWIISYATTPSTQEVLTGKNWCLHSVIYDNKTYTPSTIHNSKYYSRWPSEEPLRFEKDGVIRLPGFNSSSIQGYWQLNNDQLQISGVDTFTSVYNGTYDIDYSSHSMELQSTTTKLLCVDEHY